jgi:UDP-glucuronate 4-epimerase
MKICVTGIAGFIGFHLAQHLDQEGFEVVGIDNLNDYYDVGLKQARLAQLTPLKTVRVEILDVCDRDRIFTLFAQEQFAAVVHLAAQAGVRYSLDNPFAYIDSNIAGFMTILEACRQQSVGHLVYASSSSVYGLGNPVPYRVGDRVDTPISIYAATKRANELMAHTYSHLYGLPTTGLRFFTVYGPWGRPDMAYFKFTQAILQGQPIDIYNYGEMRRDFTYIDDVIAGLARIVSSAPKDISSSLPATPASLGATAPYRLYNLGNNHPVSLMEFIDILEQELGKTTIKRFLPLQPGDVYETYANIDNLIKDFDFRPKTLLKTGICKFATWYRQYYQ